MNALTISAAMKLPLKEFSLSDQKLNPAVSGSRLRYPKYSIVTKAELNSREFKSGASATMRSTVARVNVAPFRPATRESRKVTSDGKLPRISPPPNWTVWKLMYARPARRLSSCAASVVPLPSGASHLPLNVPPTPEATGVVTASLGLLSLKGAPMKPQTTGRVAGGGTVALAWMCALVRLSLVSAVCEPVKSMLLTVAVTVSAVCAALNWRRAVPNDAGRAAPVVVVGTAGGASCEFVMFTTKSLTSDAVRLPVASRLSTYCSLV